MAKTTRATRRKMSNFEFAVRFLWNQFWTLSVAVLGMFIEILHACKWIPFADYADNRLFAAIDLFWAYTGPFLAIGIILYALSQNCIIAVLFDKFIDKMTSIK